MSTEFKEILIEDSPAIQTFSQIDLSWTAPYIPLVQTILLEDTPISQIYTKPDTSWRMPISSAFIGFVLEYENAPPTCQINIL